MMFLRSLILTIVVFSFGLAAHAQDAAPWAGVAKALGREGSVLGGVYKIGFPRKDLTVMVGKTKVEAAAGLGSWMAFRETESGTIVDGDLVLTPEEVNPVVSALQSAGIEISAVHNHLIGETPQVMYVHFFGRGAADKLAQGLQAALAKTATPMEPAAKAEPKPLPDQKNIEEILGKAGTVNGSVLAFGFARPHSITMHKQDLAPAMGMATAINFQAALEGVAATGDFVLREDEVQKTVKSLREDGVWITAMHNHLLDDEPRMVFVHFWAEGKAEKVAGALRRALDLAK